MSGERTCNSNGLMCDCVRLCICKCNLRVKERVGVRGLTVRSLNGGGDEKTGRECVVRSNIGEKIGDVKVKCIHNTSISS